MAVSTLYAPLTYTGNGSTTAFSVSWPFLTGSLVVTEIVIATGAETVKTLTTHYTVTGGTDANGLPAVGTVNAVTAPASTVQWRITRTTPKTQAAVYNNNDAFPAKTHEAALDKLTLLLQEALPAAVDEISGDFMQLDTSGATDFWDAEGHIIRNAADGVLDTDLVTKAQLDAAALVQLGGGPLGVAAGGTSASTAAGAMVNLSVPIFKMRTPQMHGAAGDGVADDTTEVLACIAAAAAEGSAVFFPPGTYLLSGSIEIPTGMVLCGVRYQSILKLKNSSVSALSTNGDGNKVWIYTDSADNAGLENLVIDGNEDNNTTVFREVSLEGGQNLFVRGVLFKNANGIALAVSFVTNFELEGLDFQNIVGDYPASPGVPGEGIYIHNCARGLIRGIRGADIDDHLIYLDGGAGDLSSDIHVIDAIGKNCGRVSQASAFNTYRDVRRSSWTDCHAIDCGIGFTAITTVDGTLFPTDLEYNGCTSHETFGTDGADGFSASGVAGRVTMRLRYNDCKAYKSGDGVAVAAHGFQIVGVDDVELNNCTARENNDHGFLLLNCTNFKADVRAINNSRRTDGGFQGMVIGDGTSDNDCTNGLVNILATDTASGASKMQDYGLWVRTPSANIQIAGNLEGNITGRLLVDSGCTNVGWSGVYDQGSNSNGHYVRYANGVQECWHTVDATTQAWETASGAFFTVAAAQTWTYPKAFSSAMVTHITVERPNTELSGVKVHTTSTTTVTYVPFSSASLNNAAAKVILLRAIGRWY